MFYITNAWASIWSREEKASKSGKKYYKAKISTSEKKEDGAYENSYWFAYFVGKASDQIEKYKDGERFKIEKAKIINPSVKNEDGSYNHYLKVTIFELGDHGENSRVKSKKTPEKVDTIDDDELPF